MSRLPSLLLAIFALLLCVTGGAAAMPDDVPAGAPVAILIDGQSLPARLLELTDNQEVSLQQGTARRQVRLEELVIWGAYTDRDQRTRVLLADGSVVVADVLAIDADTIRLAGPLWQETSLPRRSVRAIVFRPPAEPFARDRLLERASGQSPEDDRLLLENGDELSTSWTLPLRPEPGAFYPTNILWPVTDNAEPISIALDRVVALLFKSPAPNTTERELRPTRPAPNTTERELRPTRPAPNVAAPRGTADEPAVLVGFREGSRVLVHRISRQGNGLVVELSGGVRLVTEPTATAAVDPWEAVVMLQPLQTDVTYLSDLEPLGFRHIPYLTATWSYQVDRSVSGGRLRHGGHVFAKGLGMHSSSRLAFDTRGQYRWLQAELAIDQCTGRHGSVTFRVYSQRADADWELAYESGIVRGGDPPVPMRVDIGAAQRIALIVDFADRADQWDRADWLNARLIK